MWLSILTILGLNYLLYFGLKEELENRPVEGLACPKCRQKKSPIDVLSEKYVRTETETKTVRHQKIRHCEECRGVGSIIIQHEKKELSATTRCGYCNGRGSFDDGEDVETEEISEDVFKYIYQCSKCKGQWSDTSIGALYQMRTTDRKTPRLDLLIRVGGTILIFLPALMTVYSILTGQISGDGLGGFLYSLITLAFNAIGLVLVMVFGTLCFTVVKFILKPFIFLSSYIKNNK